MFKKPGASIVSIHSDNITYIERFNRTLNETINPNIIGATENKKLYAGGEWTGIYRHLVCFEYNQSKSMQFCFFTTGPKTYHHSDDPRFYFLKDGNKLRVDNPIWIPTQYLKPLDLDVRINEASNPIIKSKLQDVKHECDRVLNKTDAIWKKYQTIKYKLNDQPIVIMAHEQMIARDKASERFCKSELEFIEKSKYKNV